MPITANIRPVASSICLLPIPTGTCSGCRLLSLLLRSRRWALFVCFSTERNFNSECKCHHMYDPWLFHSLLCNSNNTCNARKLLSLHVQPVYDPWLFRFACTNRCLLHFEYMRKQHLAVMSKWQNIFFCMIGSSSRSFPCAFAL